MKFKIVYNAWWMRKGWAMVLWPWMWVSRDKADFTDRQYRHELQHCYQVKRMGVLKFYASYLWLWMRKGYTNHPYELEAKERQYDPLTEQEKQWRESGKIEL